MSKKLIAIIVAVALTATAGITTAVVVGNKKESSGGKVDSGYSDSVDNGEYVEDEYAEPGEKAPTLEELKLNERTFDTTGSCSDTVKWKLSSDGEVLVYYGNGRMPDVEYDYKRYEPEVTGTELQNSGKSADDYISENVKYILVQEGVTSVGEYRLSFFDIAEYIYLPKSLSEIDTNAMCNNDKIKEFIFPAGNDNFKLKNSVLFTADEAVLIYYPEAKKDKSYKIPDTVKEISGSAFYMAKMLEVITIPSSVEKINSNAFSFTSIKNMVIPDTVKEIGESIFSGCHLLESASLPDHITRIPDRTFWACSALKSVKFSDKAETIGDEAFTGCESLKSIVIPSSVEIVFNSAFMFWKADQTIYFESSAPGENWGSKWDMNSDANVVWNYQK